MVLNNDHIECIHNGDDDIQNSYSIPLLPSSPLSLTSPTTSPLSPLSPISLTSPTALLSHHYSIPEPHASQRTSSTSETFERAGEEPIRCCNRSLITCLVITLPVTIPMIFYLRGSKIFRRVIEPVFLIFFAILLTFSFVFIIKILGEASSAYLASSYAENNPQPDSEVIMNRALPSRNVSRITHTRLRRSASASLYYPTTQTNGYFNVSGPPILVQSNSTRSCNSSRRNDPQRLTVHYHYSCRGSSLRRISSLSPVPLRYSRSSRRLRRARTPSPICITQQLGLSPVRIVTTPRRVNSSSPYSRIRFNYQFLTPELRTNRFMGAPGQDDLPPSYEKALSCPTVLRPDNEANLRQNSQPYMTQDVVVRVTCDNEETINRCDDELPPPSYDADTMILPTESRSPTRF